MWGLKNEFLHDPELRLHLSILFYICLSLCLAWYSTISNIQLPPTVLLILLKLHPYRGGCNPLAPFHILMELAKLQQCSHIHVVQARYVARVQ